MSDILGRLEMKVVTGSGDSPDDLMIEASAELARLTAALHENYCHPDYKYTEAKIGVEMTGWEHNPESRIEPGFKCWRRKEAP